MWVQAACIICLQFFQPIIIWGSHIMPSDFFCSASTIVAVIPVIFNLRDRYTMLIWPYCSLASVCHILLISISLRSFHLLYQRLYTIRQVPCLSGFRRDGGWVNRWTEYYSQHLMFETWELGLTVLDKYPRRTSIYYCWFMMVLYIHFLFLWWFASTLIFYCKRAYILPLVFWLWFLQWYCFRLVLLCLNAWIYLPAENYIDLKYHFGQAGGNSGLAGHEHGFCLDFVDSHFKSLCVNVNKLLLNLYDQCFHYVESSANSNSTIGSSCVNTSIIIFVTVTSLFRAKLKY